MITRNNYLENLRTKKLAEVSEVKVRLSLDSVVLGEQIRPKYEQNMQSKSL